MWGMILLGAIKAGTQIYSGYKQKEAADQNAEIMRENARYQKDQAFDQATRMTTQANAVLGGQRNAISRSGVRTDQGSPLAILKANEKAMMGDVARTRQAGQLAMDRGYNQASALEQQGQDAFNASLIGGATSFAGTLANNINIPKSTGATPIQGNFNNSYQYSKGQYNRTSLSDYTPNTRSSVFGLNDYNVGTGGYGVPNVPNVANKKKNNIYDLIGVY